MKKIFLSLISLLVSFLVFSSSSSAFVPSGKNLIYQMFIKKGAEFSCFKVPEASIIYFDLEKQVEMEMDLYYSAQGTFKAELFLGDKKRIYMESPKKSITVQDNDILSESPSKYYLFKDILIYSDYENLIMLLGQRGCDIDNVRLDRKDGRVFFVIGEIKEDNIGDNAELWIEKDKFLPYLYRVVKDGEEVSFRFTGWFRSRSLRYPARTEIFQNGNKTREIKSNLIDSSYLPENKSFFDIDAFIKKTKHGDIPLEYEFENKVDSIEKIFQ